MTQGQALTSGERMPFALAIFVQWALVGLCWCALIGALSSTPPDSEAFVAAAIWTMLAIPMILVVAAFVAFRWHRLGVFARVVALSAGPVLAVQLVVWP